MVRVGRILDQLDQPVAQDHLARRDGDVAADAIGVGARRAAAGEGALPVLGHVLQAAHQRFPFVATNSELSAAIRAAGLIDVTVTSDGADWTDNTPEEAVSQILTKLEQHGRRGMVLLHDPMKGSAARTRYLLQALKEHGYSVVALEAGED